MKSEKTGSSRLITAAIIIFIILLVFVAVFIAVKNKNNENESYGFFAMNTFFSARLPDADKSSTVFALLENEAERVESVFSRTRTDSSVYGVNNGETIYSKELCGVLAKSLELSKMTDGCFSPCLGALTSLWDFQAENPKVPDEKAIKKALSKISSENFIFDLNTNMISANNGAMLDFGGCVKGYTADRYLSILRENGIESAILSLGGSILAHGTKPDGALFRIALRDPEGKGDSVCAYLSCRDSVLSVSGGYERYFVLDGSTYHHILDASTGYPAKTDLLFAAVIVSTDETDCGLLADCFSTALYALGYEKALSLSQKYSSLFSVILMKSDRSFYTSENISDAFRVA